MIIEREQIGKSSCAASPFDAVRRDRARGAVRRSAKNPTQVGCFSLYLTVVVTLTSLRA